MHFLINIISSKTVNTNCTNDENTPKFQRSLCIRSEHAVLFVWISNSVELKFEILGTIYTSTNPHTESSSSSIKNEMK